MMPWLVLLFCAFMFSGCEETDLEKLSKNNPALDFQRHGDLTFAYFVADQAGNPKATFFEGEEVYMNFIVSNEGSTEVSLFVWYFPASTQDFFAVYRQSEEEGSWVNMGKSFQAGANTRDLAWQSIQGNETMRYTMPWLTVQGITYTMPKYEPEREHFSGRYYRSTDQPPEPLQPGRYSSSFEMDYEGQSLAFEIFFEIK